MIVAKSPTGPNQPVKITPIKTSPITSQGLFIDTSFEISIYSSIKGVVKIAKKKNKGNRTLNSGCPALSQLSYIFIIEYEFIAKEKKLC